ncbi:MAG: c-type cytochrome [Opitutus sp.]|nr:c-type cytochrome [Opitutus sp.]
MAVARPGWLLLLGSLPPAAFGADGAELFLTHCAPGHGVDGKARTPAGKKLGAKDLSERKLADAEIQRQILTGMKDAKGAERMPSFKAKLTSDEVAATAAFVKTFRP